MDPDVSLDATLIPSPSPRPKNPVFDDEKKSKVSEILNSVTESQIYSSKNSIAF